MSRRVDLADAFDLQRFLTAQEGVFETALRELELGRKMSHWMWFIFPQLDGLGQSSLAVRYAIKSRAEAAAYLAHPVLGHRLTQAASALLQVERRTAAQVMGHPDDLKLCSSMTLFEQISGQEQSLFARVIEKYYAGRRDERTLQLLRRKVSDA